MRKEQEAVGNDVGRDVSENACVAVVSPVGVSSRSLQRRETSAIRWREPCKHTWGLLCHFTKSGETNSQCHNTCLALGKQQVFQ